MDAPQEKTSPPVPVLVQPAVTTTVPALTAPAREALASAQQAVAMARQQKALWVRAAEALALAQAAAQRLDSNATISLANEARDLAKLGIAQKSYPPVRESPTTK